MDVKTANRISIKKYLSDNGVYPVKEYGYYGIFHSPFRADRTPSMKVDYNKNLWIDYGTGVGGTLVDLVMKLEKCSLSECIRLLEQRTPETTSFSFHGNNGITTDRKPGIVIQEIRPITHPALTDYLIERKLNLQTARLHCREVHYSIRGKTYFAVGFENDSGGYELRNRSFKGCTSKDLTSLQTDHADGLVFEGFVDYLSLLTLQNVIGFPQNVIVLHSVNNLSKAEKYLSGFGRIFAYLDNDDAGKEATTRLKSMCRNVTDLSDSYAGYKDLNDYLRLIRQPKKKREKHLRL